MNRVASVISPALRVALEESRRLGFLGPGPIDHHIAHAAAMQQAFPASLLTRAPGAPPPRAVDLGAGGGVPGLMLAFALPDWEWVFLDASKRRTDFLREQIVALGLTDRIEVVNGRAEELARRDRLRSRADVVVARSFGAPAVTAECAAPLLVTGGWLVVSEPPRDEATTPRWPADGVALLGFGPPTPVVVDGAHFVRLQLRSPCPDTYPRHVGIPTKRPLFR